MTGIQGIRERLTFPKNKQFQLVLSQNLLFKGMKREIRWLKSKIGAVSEMSKKLEMQKIPLKKNFPHFEAKSYDVPLCCFLKARKLDIETLETAL